MNTKLTKLSLFFLMLLLQISVLKVRCQVTIGSEESPQPFSVLELSTLNTKGGIRLPHLTEKERTDLNLSSLSTSILKQKAKGLLIYNTTRDVLEYWDGASWLSAQLVEPWRVSDKPNETATLNTQNIYQMGSIGIGVSTTEASAILNVASKNKGVLLPRVTLKSRHDKTTIPNPADGLLVYNTGKDADFDVAGYLYWMGSEWVRFENRTAISAKISSLLCGEHTLTPAKYEAGKPYKGVLSIPYTEGNGGAYLLGKEYGPINGLYYKHHNGNLAVGNGFVLFDVWGTPTVTSPEPTLLPIDFLGYSCTATIGNTQEIKVLQYVRNTVSPMDKNTINTSYTTIGNLEVRFNYGPVDQNGNLPANVEQSRIEYRTTIPTHVSAHYTKVGAGGVGMNYYTTAECKGSNVSDNWFKLAYGVDSENLNPVKRDIGSATLIFHNTKEIYRIALNANVDITQQPSAPSSITIFIEKLD